MKKPSILTPATLVLIGGGLIIQTTIRDFLNALPSIKKNLIRALTYTIQGKLDLFPFLDVIELMLQKTLISRVSIPRGSKTFWIHSSVLVPKYILYRQGLQTGSQTIQRQIMSKTISKTIDDLIGLIHGTIPQEKNTYIMIGFMIARYTLYGIQLRHDTKQKKDNNNK